MATQYIYDSQGGLTRLEVITVDNTADAVNLSVNFQVHSSFVGYVSNPATPSNFEGRSYYLQIQHNGESIFYFSGTNGAWPGGSGWQTVTIQYCGTVPRSYGSVRVVYAQFFYFPPAATTASPVSFAQTDIPLPAYVPPDGQDELSNYTPLTLGTSHTFTISNPNNIAHTDIVTAIIGNTEIEVGSVNVAAHGTNTISWTPPSSLGAEIPNAMSGNGMMRLTTRQGGTDVGAQNYGAVFNVPAYTYTLGSISVTKTNYPNISQYVAGKSTAKFTMPSFPSAQYGATLSGTLKITNPSGSVVVSQSIASGGTYSLTGSSVGTYTATLTITDSRGVSATKTVTVTYITNPSVSISSFTAQRQGDTDDVAIAAEGVYDHTITGNTATLTVKQGVTTIATATGVNGVATTTGTDTLLSSTSAVYTATIIDYLGNKATQDVTVTQAFKYAQFGGGDNGRGIAFGKASSLSGEDTFEVGLPMDVSNGIYQFHVGEETINNTPTWNISLSFMGVRRIDLNFVDGLTFYDANGTATKNYPAVDVTPPTSPYWRVNDYPWILRDAPNGNKILSPVPLGDYPYLGENNGWINIYYSSQYPSAWIASGSGILVYY